MIVLDGKAVAEERYNNLPQMHGEKLIIVTVGDDPASKIYVRRKIKACEKKGLQGINERFDENVSKAELKQKIMEWSIQKDVAGIMVQHPIPNHLKGIEDEIPPILDVDGIGSYNMLRTLSGQKPYHYPATPLGILHLLEHYNIPVAGKHAVVIGRSDIVGKPLAAMLDARNATVTQCHSKTKGLWKHTRMADIIISAVGKARFIDNTYIGQNEPVLIDVGMNRDEEGHLCGDIDLEDCRKCVSAGSEVPGGVGPMTVETLIEEVIMNVVHYLEINQH